MLKSLVATLLLSLPLTAQTPIPAMSPSLPQTRYFALPGGPLTLHTTAVPNRPFTVTGEGGGILGMQDGSVELWQFPVKIFSNLHLRAEIDGYSVPIDLNSNAATLDVSPDHTTLTYSHSLFTVRQHMFVPAGETGRASGGVILFEIHSVAPLTLSVQLTPSMQTEWPVPQYGTPSWDWQPMGGSGAWKLNTDNPGDFALLALPGAKPGMLSPYQEHPRTLPLEFRLRYEPAKDAGTLYPLVCELAQDGERNNRAGVAAVQARMVAHIADLPRKWQQTQTYYQHFFDTRLVATTPDPAMNKALAWAELAIEKSKVATTAGEIGLVAGWFPSFDSARPGFGWFFGRDALWTMFAIDSYGDDKLVRQSLDFLMARQRPDGKMMHEYAQGAAQLTGSMSWDKLEYEYAAADATPLFLLAMRDYVRTTGDTNYLREHWKQLQLAYTFESTHDSDGDGVYDNSQGTGWVEGWPPKAPHQESYLAALDRDATIAMAQLAQWMADEPLAAAAQARAEHLRAAVEAYRQQNDLYAFSRNADGTYDSTRTIYPSVALWNSPGGLSAPDATLRDWSSHFFATDWGVRAVAENDPIYDANSYHQGTVWPLFTGWMSVAAYRTGHPMAGYRALRQNADLTFVQDPGAVTELLSGRFYQPLGRSSSHQLWSSAMVISPAVRGMFGLEADAPNHALVVHPSLPPEWNAATLQHVRVGDTLYTVTMARQGAALHVTAQSDAPTTLCLRPQQAVQPGDTACAQPASRLHAVTVPLPAFEVSLQADLAPQFGDETSQPRVIEEKRSPGSLSLTLEAQPGSAVNLVLRRNSRTALSVAGAALKDDVITVAMPGQQATDGRIQFVTQQVELRWR